MSTVITTTAQQIIDDAYTLIKVKSFLDPLEPEQVEFALRMLNSMLKQWEKAGAYLHTITDVTIHLYGSKQYYTIGPGTSVYDVEAGKPIKLISARRQDSDGNDTPVNVLSIDDYKRIPLKSSVGEVVSVAYQRLRDYGKLFVWPVNDETPVGSSTKDLICSFQIPIDIFDSNEDTPDFPSDQNLAVIYGLAAILINTTPLSASERAEIKNESNILYQKVWANEQESVSFFFKPDVRR